jgi:hypothetical protein
MRPRTDEIVSSIVRTYEDYVLPEVEEPYARSLALTLANLLRLVKLRIEQEGPMLFADNQDLRETLAVVAAYLGSEPELNARFAGCRDEIEAVLQREFRRMDEYPTLQSVDEEAAELRWPLQHAIRALETARGDLGASEGYQSVRERIRQYLRRSIERDGNLIIPAFTGERR